mmetsp:Transcript_1391/g.4528  ORF Transcript_1391/g.4528 Transcript_1391/m.4528 type:complete len:272 (+) Transcript_1391:140-955(+)
MCSRGTRASSRACSTRAVDGGSSPQAWTAPRALGTRPPPTPGSRCPAPLGLSTMRHSRPAVSASSRRASAGRPQSGTRRLVSRSTAWRATPVWSSQGNSPRMGRPSSPRARTAARGSGTPKRARSCASSESGAPSFGLPPSRPAGRSPCSACARTASSSCGTPRTAKSCGAGQATKSWALPSPHAAVASSCRLATILSGSSTPVPTRQRCPRGRPWSCSRRPTRRSSWASRLAAASSWPAAPASLAPCASGTWSPARSCAPTRSPLGPSAA